MQASQPLQPERLTIEPGTPAVRLDRAIADWRGLSRAAVIRLLDHGAITCNGRVLTGKNKGDLLQPGDNLELDVRYSQGEAPLADHALALDVVSMGEGWLVVNKPAGVPVRPHALGETGSVLNAVAARYPEVIGVGEGGLRSGIVHRLDTDTSGTLLIATQQRAWERFRAAFAEHRICKCYAALVHGVPAEAGSAKLYLCVTQHTPARVVVEADGQRSAGARLCSLSWRVLERFGERASLIEVDLHTGFLHQVRVMMSDLGHAVIGDTWYGGGAPDLAAPRQMLHAKSLSYEEVLAESQLPDDMMQMMAKLRG